MSRVHVLTRTHAHPANQLVVPITYCATQNVCNWHATSCASPAVAYMKVTTYMRRSAKASVDLRTAAMSTISSRRTVTQVATHNSCFLTGYTVHTLAMLACCGSYHIRKSQVYVTGLAGNRVHAAMAPLDMRTIFETSVFDDCSE